MKSAHILPAVALAALTLASGVASAQVTDTATGRRSNTPTVTAPMNHDRMASSGDADIARQLIAANRKEVEAARAAQTEGQNAHLKTFAQRLERDHSKAADELEGWLEKNGGMSAGMGAMHDSMGGMRHDSMSQMNTDSARLGRDNNRMDDSTHMRMQHDSAGYNAGQGHQDMDQEHSWQGKTGAEFDKAWVESLEDEHKKEIDDLRNNIIPRIQDSSLKIMVQRQMPDMGAHLRELEQLEHEIK